MHSSNWFLKRYFQNIHQGLAGAAAGASAAGAAARRLRRERAAARRVAQIVAGRRLVRQVGRETTSAPRYSPVKYERIGRPRTRAAAPCARRSSENRSTTCSSIAVHHRRVGRQDAGLEADGVDDRARRSPSGRSSDPRRSARCWPDARSRSNESCDRCRARRTGCESTFSSCVMRFVNVSNPQSNRMFVGSQRSRGLSGEDGSNPSAARRPASVSGNGARPRPRGANRVVRQRLRRAARARERAPAFGHRARRERVGDADRHERAADAAPIRHDALLAGPVAVEVRIAVRRAARDDWRPRPSAPPSAVGRSDPCSCRRQT